MRGLGGWRGRDEGEDEGVREFGKGWTFSSVSSELLVPSSKIHSFIYGNCNRQLARTATICTIPIITSFNSKPISLSPS